MWTLRFSWVVDALIAVDLRRSTSQVLERYMGAAGAARFRKHHAIRA